MKNLFIRFKKVIINFIKGIAIGIAMIVPGVSGGTLALMLGIYNDIIDSVNNLFKNFGKSIKTLLPILLGAVVGFLALVFPIKIGLEKCPLVVITLFVGLIIGGIPTLYRKVRTHESVKGFSLTAVSIAFMVGTCFLVSLLSFSETTLLNEFNFGLWMYLFLAGMVVSLALVMPGISGSMMLMVMGLYTSVLAIISKAMHFESFGQCVMVIIPIALGAVVGFFLISYIMGKLLKHHEVGTYFVIIGLVIGSIGTIYFLSASDIASTWNALQIIISVVLFIVGFAASFFLDYYFNKKYKKDEKEASSSLKIEE